MSETSELTGPAIKMLKQMGIWATRLQAGKVRVRGGWMQLCPTGTPDVLCRPSGRVVWIETKLGKYGQSVEQLEFEHLAKEWGDEYHLCRTLDEVLEAIRNNHPHVPRPL